MRENKYFLVLKAVFAPPDNYGLVTRTRHLCSSNGVKMQKKTQKMVQGKRKTCWKRGKTCREKEKREKDMSEKKYFLVLKAVFAPITDLSLEPDTCVRQMACK